MLRVVGIPVSDEDVQWLIDALYRDAHADAVHAALEISSAAERESFAAALTVDDRRAILRQLVDPPGEALSEIRGQLMRDSRFTS